MMIRRLSSGSWMAWKTNDAFMKNVNNMTRKEARRYRAKLWIEVIILFASVCYGLIRLAEMTQ